MKLTDSQLRALPTAFYSALKEMGSGRPVRDSFILGLSAEMAAAAHKILPGPNGTIPAEQRAMYFPLGEFCRALTTDVYGAAGALVPDELAGIEPLLRAYSVCGRAGARILNLRSNFSIPRELTASSFQWLHDLETITESDGTFGALNLTPHRLGGACAISSQLDTQTSGLLTQFLVESLARGLASGVDAGALTGDGTFGQPLGLWYAPNVNTVTFSAAATRAKSLSFVRQIADANADDERITFVGHPATREKWGTLQTFSGGSATLWSDEGTVAGKKAFATTAAPATGIAAGDFSQMVIALFGEDTPLRILVNPFTQSLAGRISFVAQVYADTGLLRPACFTRNADSALQ